MCIQNTYPEEQIVHAAVHNPTSDTGRLSPAVKHPSHFRLLSGRFCALQDRVSSAEGCTYATLFPEEPDSPAPAVQILSAFFVKITNSRSEKVTERLLLLVRHFRRSPDDHILHQKAREALGCQVLEAGEFEGESVMGADLIASQAALVPFRSRDKQYWGFKKLVL